MNYKNIIKSLSVVTVAAIMTTGCVGDNENLQTAQSSLQKQIKTLENDNTKKDEQINALKAELSKSSSKDEVQNEYILQQAKPGECFAKVKVPAKYESIVSAIHPFGHPRSSHLDSCAHVTWTPRLMVHLDTYKFKMSA